MIYLEDGHCWSQKTPSLGRGLSEYSFANAFAFRQVHDFRIIKKNSCAALAGQDYTGQNYVMPLQDPQKDETYRDFLFDWGRQEGMIYPLPEDWRDFMEGHGWRVEQRDADSDYIYESSAMAALTGRKLHKKRNLIKQCKERYTLEQTLFTETSRKDILQILDHWQSAMDLGWNETDYAPCREAALLARELNLEGLVFYADENPAGFLLGEALTADTFVLHFAKARVEFKGIYPYMFQAMAEHVKDRYSYLNLEQDLGSDALRQSKRSYQPLKQLKKLRAYSS